MAYEYDALGNVIGEYESEEERKRRMDAEQADTPVKQTITTNPDGTQEMTIKGTPQSLSSMNPNTPTVTGPASPDDTFSRMQQIESGNRDFDAQGRPIQSPAGAMYRNQVMPATARNPGFGITPARDESPEEYNRVGAEYYQAMLQKFGGDKAKAAAAYNAGPGRVDQNIRANQGQMNVSQLPRETQGYLQKLGNVVGSVIPSAEAGTVPQPPANVGSSGFEPYDRNRPGNAAYEGGIPTYDRNRPGAAPFTGGASVPQPDSVINNQVAAFEAKQQPLNLPDDPYQQYLSLPDNPKDRLAFAYDKNTPENLQKHVKKQVSDTLAQEAGFVKAEAQIKTMDENAVAKALREKTTGGSYVKAILFGLLGMENSKGAEIAKLGIGKEMMTQVDGQPVMIKMAENGTPISGINATTGKELTPQELIAGAQYASVQKGAQTHTGKMQDTTTGEVYYERTTPQGIELVDNQGKKYKGPSSNLRPFGIGSDINTKNIIQQQELQNKLAYAGPTASAETLAKIVSDSEGKFGPLDPTVKATILAGRLPVTGTVPTTAGASVGAPAGAVAPVATGAAGASVGAPAGAVAPVATGAAGAPASAGAAGTFPGQREIDQKTKAAAAEVIGTDMGKVKATQPQVESQADQLITQVENLFKIGDGKAFRDTVGFKGAGLGFGLLEKPIAGTKEADFISAFNQIKGETFRQAFESLRGGGQITEKEGAAATDALNRMQLSQSENEFKKASKEFNENVMRMIDIRREKLGLPPKYNLKPMSETEKKKESKKEVGTKENPIEIKF